MNDKMRSENDVCGGMKHCKDRYCDNTKDDCKECLKDVDEALKQCNKDLDMPMISTEDFKCRGNDAINTIVTALHESFDYSKVQVRLRYLNKTQEIHFFVNME